MPNPKPKPKQIPIADDPPQPTRLRGAKKPLETATTTATKKNVVQESPSSPELLSSPSTVQQPELQQQQPEGAPAESDTIRYEIPLQVTNRSNEKIKGKNINCYTFSTTKICKKIVNVYRFKP